MPPTSHILPRLPVEREVMRTIHQFQAVLKSMAEEGARLTYLSDASIDENKQRISRSTCGIGKRRCAIESQLVGIEQRAARLSSAWLCSRLVADRPWKWRNPVSRRTRSIPEMGTVRLGVGADSELTPCNQPRRTGCGGSPHDVCLVRQLQPNYRSYRYLLSFWLSVHHDHHPRRRRSGTICSRIRCRQWPGIVSDRSGFTPEALPSPHRVSILTSNAASLCAGFT